MRTELRQAARGAFRTRGGQRTPHIRSRTFAGCLATVALVGFMTACRTGSGSQTADPSPTLAPAVSVSAADLPGSWGLASYRVETDRPRTETEAKGACSNPYKIEAGANGGVMMHLADQATASEVFVKSDAEGRTFIGPPGPAGVVQDRMIVSFEGGVMIAEWLDPSARERYGTMLFVRCAST